MAATGGISSNPGDQREVCSALDRTARGLLASVESMRWSFWLILLSFGSVVITLLMARDEVVPDVAKTVDLERYQGTWFEVARFPNRFQRVCAGDVTATYSLREDGRVEVINRCGKQDGSTATARGVAKRVQGEVAKLKVRFAPSFLSFLPFVWADYWILELATDYSYAVVGSPNRKYLWILSRDPVVDEALYAQLKERLKAQGFPVEQLVRTSHGVRAE